MIFHIFICMNIINGLNCRCIDDNEKNVFKNFCNNPLFFIVFFAELGVQTVFNLMSTTELGRKLFGVAELNMVQSIIVCSLGFSVLLVNPLSKFIPKEKFEFMNRFDLEGDICENPAWKFNHMFENWWNAKKDKVLNEHDIETPLEPNNNVSEKENSPVHSSEHEDDI